MAWFRFNPQGKTFSIRFAYMGVQYNRAFKLADAKEAERVCGQVEQSMIDIQRGRLDMPPDADVPSFLISGGKLTCRITKPQATVTLKSVYDEYRAYLTPGSKEANTLALEALHWRHFCRVLGGDMRFERFGLNKVQDYVNARVSEGVSRATIHKELCTLKVVSKWARRRGVVPRLAEWDRSDLTLPKGNHKKPFQSWEHIERQIEMGVVPEEEQQALWETLWLSYDQTLEFLDWARGYRKHPWFFPLVAVAAYTGARRSEILRSEVADWDFGMGQAMIRQKKADKTKYITYRYLPIHRDLADILQGWFGERPEGPYLISDAGWREMTVARSAHGFRTAVAGTKWEVLRGYHVLRHSFASNMAARGVDQRLIDQIMGHTTDEMSRRYRHLGKEQMRTAVESAFAVRGGR